MKFFVKREGEDTPIVDNLDAVCKQCLHNCKKIQNDINCPLNGTKRIMDQELRKNFGDQARVFICAAQSLFPKKKDFIDKFSFFESTLQYLDFIQQEIKKQERKKNEQVLHNIKKLNAQGIQDFYDLRNGEFENTFDHVQEIVKSNPRKVTFILLKCMKMIDALKSELTIHDKLLTDKPVLSKMKHDIKKVILNVYHHFEDELRNNRVAFRISDKSWKSNLDFDTINIAFFHLFSNAVKYIRPSTELHVDLFEDNQNFIIELKMESVQIKDDEVDRIFEDRYSGEFTKIHHTNGSGLGMGIVQKALKLNNGTISVIAGECSKIERSTPYAKNVFRIQFLKE